MNNTAALPIITADVVKMTGKESGYIERFIKSFFSHIEDAMTVDGFVTIDGLGTFRHSDTNECGVEFIPDNALSEALNEPFDMFSPVAVGQQLASDSEEQIKSDECDHIDIVESQIPDSASDSNSIDLPSVSEDLPMPSAENETTVETRIIEDRCDLTEENNSDEVVYEESVENNNPTHNHLIWIGVFVLGFLSGITGGLILHDYIFDNNADAVDGSNGVIVCDDINIEGTAAQIGDTVSVIADDCNKLQIDTVADASLAEVPTVTYDTVTPTRFLTTMARKYYGQMEYWVFIYDANSDRLGNPNRIKPGTDVLIPDKASFTAGESPQETLERAKRIAEAIYSRYE